MNQVLKNVLKFAVARAQERSTVAGAVAVASTVLGVALPGDATVNAVVGVAGLIAMLVPGGK